MIGHNYQQAILILNERASGILNIKKVEIRNAESAARVTICLIND
jgi:hypothetical protein